MPIRTEVDITMGARSGTDPGRVRTQRIWVWDSKISLDTWELESLEFPCFTGGKHRQQMTYSWCQRLVPARTSLRANSFVVRLVVKDGEGGAKVFGEFRGYGVLCSSSRSTPTILVLRSPFPVGVRQRRHAERILHGGICQGVQKDFETFS